jgi:hypothetical protein
MAHPRLRSVRPYREGFRVNVYPWLMFLHVGGLLTFVTGHGASAMVAFRLRNEREPARIGALLDLSSASIGVAYLGLLLLLASGIAAGFNGGLWDRWWIWISLGLLVVILGAMYPMGSGYYAKVRHAVGMRAYSDPKDAPAPEPATPAELEALLVSPRPWVLLAMGGGGVLVILWLMLMQPF